MVDDGGFEILLFGSRLIYSVKSEMKRGKRTYLSSMRIEPGSTVPGTRTSTTVLTGPEENYYLTNFIVSICKRYISELFVYLLSVLSLAFEPDERPKKIFPSFRLSKLKLGIRFFMQES